MFLHRQAARRHARVRPLAGGAGVRDAGNIVVMEDRDGVAARRNEFNLEQRSLSFVPTAAGATRYRYQVGEPTYDDAAAQSGEPITALGDDDTRTFPLPFSFPFFGAVYAEIFVNSDGNLTFGEGDGASLDQGFGRMAAGPPRIAGLFDDLDPSKAGSSGSVRVLSQPARFVVSWDHVPLYSDFGAGARQTFQVRLYPDGRIEIAYAQITAGSAVVGIAPGILKAPITAVSFLADPSAEYSGMVAERFSSQIEIDIQAAAQKFYQTHEDAYDYLAFYNNSGIAADTNGSVSWEFTLRNHRRGYGDAAVDIGAQFGSSGRLQAVLNMGSLQQFPKDPKGTVVARAPTADTPVSILAHEAGHLFLAYASIRDARDANARPMLGYQNAHWIFNFNSDASLLEGNRIRDNGEGTVSRFTSVGMVEHYSALDQYLMGFIPPEEVEPGYPFGMYLVTGVPVSFNRRLPQSGVNFDGARRDVHIDELIQAEGRRTPDFTVAQRRFRFAFILIVPTGTDASADDLARLESYRTAFESFYQQATANHALADTALRRNLRLSLFPAAGVVAGRTGAASLSVETAPTAPLNIVLHAANGFATLPASVTIPAGATSVGLAITGARAGVEELSAIPVDSRYDTAYARVQVAPASAVRLDLVSNDGRRVVARLTDVNDLPYPGVRIAAAASEGSVSPAVAATDQNGNVTFMWTAGAELRLSLEGSVEAALTLSARPRIAAAVVLNAASLVAGAAPASLATIYGANFIGAADEKSVRASLAGRAVPLSYVSDTQLTFYVPDDVPLGRTELVIANALGISDPVPVNVTPVSPGIFFDAVSGFGQILVAGTGRLTLDRPARAGEYLEIYCTGLGGFEPEVRIGGVSARVLFSGAVAGSPGLNQVNVEIPEGLASGAQPLYLIVNGVSSNQVKVGVE
jgi:uncharacterized protein (TIGR03437 family)